MTLGMRIIGALLAILTAAAALVAWHDAAQGRPRKPRKPPVATVKAPPPAPAAAILPAPPLPELIKDVPTAKKPTELQEMLKTRTSYDFAPVQMKALVRYDIPVNKREAYANDNDFNGMNAPRMEAYIAKIADRLLACWSGYRPPLMIMVTSEARSTAFAYDSGVIRFSAGFLESMQTTHELAYALAHEIGHIVGEHDARRTAFSSAIEKTVGLMTSTAIIGQELRVTGTGNNLNVGFRREFGSTDILISGYSARSLSGDVLVPFRKIKQEYQADRIAYDLIVCARFDESAAASTLLALGNAEVPDLRGLLLAARLGTEFVANELMKPKDDDDLGTRLLHTTAKMGLGEVFKSGVDAIAKKIQRDMGGEKRGEKLAEYTSKTYNKPEKITEPAKDTGIAQVKDDPYWKSLIAIVNKIGPAAEKIKNAPLEAGLGKPIAITAAEFQEWSALPTDPRIPLSYMIVGSANMAAGQPVAALRAWESGSNSRWGFRTLLIETGRAQFANGDAAALSRTIDRGRQRLGNIPDTLPLDLRLALLKEQPVEVEKIAAKCLVRGGDALYKQCVAPLNYDPACRAKTPEGKTDLDAATAGRQLNTLIDMPAMLDSANAADGKPTKLLSCLKPAGKSLPKIR